MNVNISKLFLPCASLLLFCGSAQAENAAASSSNELESEYTISDESVADFVGPSAEEQREHGEVPAMFRDDSKLDDNHINQELGVNVYTAPAISKIFDQLEGLPSIPDDYVLRKRPELLPTDSGALALEMGFLLADGFIAVRSGRMNDIKPIALDLSRYGKAMGVGERMNVHSASLLEQAEKGLLEQFKTTLAATQNDVNAELIALKDPDQAHLIALGGWVRALTAAAAALEANFDADKAMAIFYAEAPSYFGEMLGYLNPKTAEKLRVNEMQVLLAELIDIMNLPAGAAPTKEKCTLILNCSKKLSSICVGRGYEF
ncbi:MAG: hypothetical protein R3Y56_10435 [Akkermansia sp.]